MVKHGDIFIPNKNFPKLLVLAVGTPFFLEQETKINAVLLSIDSSLPSCRHCVGEVITVGHNGDNLIVSRANSLDNRAQVCDNETKGQYDQF